MKTKYEFHPDLKKYANFSAPIIPCVVPVMQKLMGVLYMQERSDAEITVSRLQIPARDGAELRALLYTPKNVQENGPCLLFFHGGGFIYNAAPHHFALARTFAQKLGWKTLLVDYRLAPKYKFPTAPQDAFDAYSWLVAQADVLRIDPEKIAVCGDSAGGNLAAVVCLMARERNMRLPKAQMLLYPVTDRRMITESVQKYIDTPMCSSQDMKKYFALYLKAGDRGNSPYLSPIEADTLEGLPAAYVEAAEFDCLRDEGIAYAKALRKAGVPVELHEAKGAMHGYDIAADTDFVQSFVRLRVDFLKKTVEG